MARYIVGLAIALVLISSLNSIVFSQQQAPGAIESIAVPRVVTFNGALRDATGQPLSGVMGLTFSLYRDQQGGTALWTENQNVQADSQGQYTAILGATQQAGLPMDLFTSGAPRWLGVQVQIPGESEQARILLVSVPYALKAADAETLGGKPVSAFALAQPADQPSSSAGAGPTSVGNRSGFSPRFSGFGTGTSTTGRTVRWSDTNGTLADGSIQDNGNGVALAIAPSGNIGIGNGFPAVKLQIESDSTDPVPENLNNPLLRLSNFNNGTTNNYAGLEFSSLDNGGVERDGASIQGVFVNRGPAALDTALGLFTRSMSDGSGVHELRIDPHGNVGIGTIAPTAKLQIESDSPDPNPNTLSNTIQVLSNYTNNINGNYASLEFRSKDTSGTDRVGATISGVFSNRSSSMVATDLSFYTRNIDGSVSNPLYLKAGNVGIGTNAPGSALDVRGTATAMNFVGNGSGLTNLNVASLSGPVANNQTTATASNNANSIVLRDGTGNFTANVITASGFIGNGSGLTNVNATSVGGSSAAVLRTRGIVYLGGCDSCSALQSTDSQKTIFINVVGAMTINSITCYSDSGSPVININRNPGSGANPVLSSNLTCSPTGVTSTSIAPAQATMNSNDTLDFAMITPDGVAKRVTVAIQATIN